MERITTRFRTRTRTQTGARTDRPNYWRTLGVVVAAGGAVGWALVRSTRVVLAPGLDAASRGADTEAAKAGIGAQTSSAAPSVARGTGPGGRVDETVPPRAFRTADALAGAATAAGPAPADTNVPGSDAGAGGGDRAAGTAEAAVDRPLAPPAWASATGKGMVEETAEAGPQAASLASHVEVVGRSADVAAAFGQGVHRSREGADTGSGPAATPAETLISGPSIERAGIAAPMPTTPGVLAETPEAQPLAAGSDVASRSGGDAGIAASPAAETGSALSGVGIAHPETVAAGLGEPRPGAST
ncbi:MAG TPA: hypothetical protein VER37_06650, partial [Thermomicrobiales bacterium]|nr:hypothetical protein [Thermomicrobiales bacterium]